MAPRWNPTFRWPYGLKYPNTKSVDRGAKPFATWYLKNRVLLVQWQTALLLLMERDLMIIQCLHGSYQQWFLLQVSRWTSCGSCWWHAIIDLWSNMEMPTMCTINVEVDIWWPTMCTMNVEVNIWWKKIMHRRKLLNPMVATMVLEQYMWRNVVNAGIMHAVDILLVDQQKCWPHAAIAQQVKFTMLRLTCY